MSKLQVDTIYAKDAINAPNFPAGLTGTGATFTANVSIAGTLTYDDVTNIDSVGIVTAGKGLRSTTGGLIVSAGVSTIGAKLSVAGITSLGDVVSSGIVTADSFYGDGSNLTNVGVTTAAVPGISTQLHSNFGTINASGIITATAFVPTQGQLSNRNVIINGAMKISQRGTSETSVGNQNGYGQWPDRFREFLAATAKAGVWTISQDSESPNGFTKSTKWDCTTAGTLAADSYGGYEQYIEGQNVQRFAKGTSDAQPGVLSFYVKTNKTGTYAIEFRDNDNSRMVGGTYTVSDTNWNRYQVPMPADTTGAWDDDTSSSLWIRWWLVAGSNFTSGTPRTAWAAGVSDQFLAAGQTVDLSDNTSNEWHITGVQLEVGSTATPFEHTSYQHELLECQRYFAFIGAGFVTGARATSSSALTYAYTSPVPMRGTPTVTTSDTLAEGTWNMRCFRDSTGTNDSTNTPGIGSMTAPNGTNIRLTQAGFSVTDDRASVVMIQGGAIVLDAEIS